MKKPHWCPDRKCRQVGEVAETICGGLSGETPRQCIRGAGNPVMLDKLTSNDINAMRDLLDRLDDAQVAVIEREEA